ncbi:MAG: NAD-dependent epimerase/dehydratase family protein [Anaerolineales bacterium]|nr:NAD-dependent epimerase/dehydratase family protein [Anaerolineales bacterium]
MTRYFITGGFGFLGQYIVQAIHDHDPQGELRVLVRTPRRTYLPIRSLERVRLASGELSKPESYAAELQSVETVIHSAALISFKQSDRQALYQSNVLGTRLLAQTAAAQGCKNFILISSISAIGRRNGQLADETFLPDLEEKQAHDPYGYSKRMSEIEALHYAGQMRVVILNPSVIIGPGSTRIIRVARWLRRLPAAPMIATLNSFVDVRDAARAAALALGAGRSGERYIVTGENVDMLTFTHLALHALGSRARVFAAPDGLIPLGDGLVGLLDRLHLNPGVRKISELNVDKAYSTKKIRDEMGWVPNYALEQSLADTLAAANLL